MHLGVDLFGNVIDISHELLDIVELFLPLLDDVLHVGRLSLHLQLLHIELLLLLEQGRLLAAPMQGRGTLVVHQRLPSLHQVQMLLHLQVQLLALLLELVHDLGQAPVISLLLLLLLALRAIRHRNLPIGLDLLLEVSGHLTHLVLLVLHTLAEVIVVSLCADLIFKLDQSAKIVLEFRKIAFNFNVF